MIKIKFWCARCGRKGKAKVADVARAIRANVPLGWYVENASDMPFVLCPHCAQSALTNQTKVE